MGKKDDEDEGRKRPKKKGAGAVISIANTLTPFRYALKSPASTIFTKANTRWIGRDRVHGSFARCIPGHLWKTRQAR